MKNRLTILLATIALSIAAFAQTPFERAGAVYNAQRYAEG